MAAVRDALGPAAFAAAWDAGAALSPAEAVAEALTPVTEVEQEGQPAANPVAALGLTPREGEVLRLVARGLSDREIGEALFISPRTASGHVAHLLAKLGLETRAAAAAFGVRHGLA